MPFAWGQAKIQVWGSFKSLISYFNIIFDFVLFRFKFILFEYYFPLDLFYFDCILLYFRNGYLIDSVLEQKKEDWELIRAWKYEIQYKNMLEQNVFNTTSLEFWW